MLVDARIFRPCSYYPTYMELAEEIKFTMPTAKVSGFVGRSSSFEIYVGEYLIFSKLGAGFFPDPGDVVTVSHNPLQQRSRHRSCSTSPPRIADKGGARRC